MKIQSQLLRRFTRKLQLIMKQCSLVAGICLILLATTAFNHQNYISAHQPFFQKVLFKIKLEVVDNLLKSDKLSKKKAGHLLLPFLMGPLNCGPAFYQIIEGSLEVLDISTGVYNDLANNSAGDVNAIGYNTNDDYIYGFADDTNLGSFSLGDVVRIEADGTTTVVHSGTGESPIAGDMDDNNLLWFRSSGGNQGRRLKNVNISTGLVSGNFNFTGVDLRGSTGITHADIVYVVDNINGDKVYSMGSDHQLTIWNFATLAINRVPVTGWTYGAGSTASGTLTAGETFGAGWTDKDGNIYFSNNGNPGKAAVWRIDNYTTGSPVATWVSDSQDNVQRNDGASCPLAQNPFVAIESNCSDGIDNDGDLMIDCNDLDCFPLNLPTQIELSTNTIICLAIPFADLGDYTVTVDGNSASPLTSCDGGNGVNIDVGTIANHTIVVTRTASNCNVTIPVIPPCKAGIIAPNLSQTVINNICLSVTADLTTITANNFPTTADTISLEWHTINNPSDSSTLVDKPKFAVAGTYYAVFHDTIFDCYSSGNPVTVTINACINSSISNICPSNTVDLDALHGGIPPTGTTLIWSIDNDASDGLSSSETSPTPNSGIYYPYYYEAAKNCYSPPGAAVTVTVNACSSPEIIAIQDTLSIKEDMMATITVLSNDTIRDTEIDTTGLQIFTQPTSGGTATFNFDGTITYMPPINFYGMDTLAYIVCDTNSVSNTYCDTSIVILTVDAVNDKPVATNDSLTIPEETTALIIKVQLNDIDVDDNPLTTTIVGASTQGVTPIVENGDSITYTPPMSFNGMDTITYQVCDNGSPALCDMAIVVIEVIEVISYLSCEHCSTATCSTASIDSQIEAFKKIDGVGSNEGCNPSITRSVSSGDTITFCATYTTPAVLEEDFISFFGSVPVADIGCDASNIIDWRLTENCIPMVAASFQTVPPNLPTGVLRPAWQVQPNTTYEMCYDVVVEGTCFSVSTPCFAPHWVPPPCNLIIGTANHDCTRNDGTFDVRISFSNGGQGAGTYTQTNNGLGTLGGDDPNTNVSGTIIIANLPDGSGYDLDITGNGITSGCTFEITNTGYTCSFCPKISTATVEKDDCVGNTVTLTATVEGGVEGDDYYIEWLVNGNPINQTGSATFGVDGEFGTADDPVSALTYVHTLAFDSSPGACSFEDQVFIARLYCKSSDLLEQGDINIASTTSNVISNYNALGETCTGLDLTYLPTGVIAESFDYQYRVTSGPPFGLSWICEAVLDIKTPAGVSNPICHPFWGNSCPSQPAGPVSFFNPNGPNATTCFGGPGNGAGTTLNPASGGPAMINFGGVNSITLAKGNWQVCVFDTYNDNNNGTEGVMNYIYMKVNYFLPPGIGVNFTKSSIVDAVNITTPIVSPSAPLTTTTHPQGAGLVTGLRICNTPVVGVDFILPNASNCETEITVNCTQGIVKYSSDNGLSYLLSSPPAPYIDNQVIYYQVTTEDCTFGCGATGTYTLSNCLDTEIIAVQDTLTIQEDIMTTITVLSNDTIRDGQIDTTGMQIHTQPTSGGTASMNPVGMIDYTPIANFNGLDTIAYIVCDTASIPNTLCDTAIVVIMVNPVNDKPVAINDTITINEDTPILIDIQVNDTDSDGDLLSSSIIGTSTQGIVPVLENGDSINYTPPIGFLGLDTITYQICDNGVPILCDTAYIFVTVQAHMTHLKLRVLLQGAMLGVVDTLMRDDIRQMGLIPLTEPYDTMMNPRFTHVSGGGETTIPAILTVQPDTTTSIVDWVFVEIRDAADSTQVVRTVSALVRRDGHIVTAATAGDVVLASLPTIFYVTIKHRNHLGVMTALPISPISDTARLDFTNMTDANLYHFDSYDGLEMTTINGKRALWAGNSLDLNLINKVKYDGSNNDRIKVASDVISHINNTAGLLNADLIVGYLLGDVNLDGKAKYDGSVNDRIWIQNIILNYPLNFNEQQLNNFNLMLEQIPE